MAEASIPAITRNTRPVATYMIPRRLWSTVTTQSWRRSSARRRPSSRVRVGASTLMPSPSSLERPQVGGELVHLVAGQLHRRHQRAALEHARVVDPRAQILGRVRGGAGRDGPP